MAKRSRIESALKKAQSVLSNYVPGRKRAEATIDEVMRVLGQARGVLTGRGRRKRAAPRNTKTGRRKSARRKTAAARKGSARRSSR
jgi:hypothetical protein